MRDAGIADADRAGRLALVELLIATNPDPDSSPPYLLRLPIGDGLVFRTKDTWPRTSALYCHPVPNTEWPDEPDIVERVPLRACARRGAAIDVVADRGREQRSQIVFTNARGREMVFWQSPRTRKQARPDVRLPTARAAGIAELEIVVDTNEKYACRFDAQQVRTVRRGLPCGDYAISVGGKLIAAVERKSLADLASSLSRPGDARNERRHPRSRPLRSCGARPRSGWPPRSLPRRGRVEPPREAAESSRRMALPPAGPTRAALRACPAFRVARDGGGRPPGRTPRSRLSAAVRPGLACTSSPPARRRRPPPRPAHHPTRAPCDRTRGRRHHDGDPSALLRQHPGRRRRRGNGL